MKKEKTGIGKLLQKIGQFFGKIFKHTENVWGTLGDDIKNSFLQGSKIIEIINNNLDEDGGYIYDLIMDYFPNLDKDKLRDGLLKIADALDLGIEFSESTGTTELLEKIAAYLKSKEKDVWAAISSLAAKLVAKSLAGDLISWATVELLMEFVYHNFIKDNELTNKG